MFQSVRSSRPSHQRPEIRIAPLIDMVFILLIFFVVTTTFVRETGVTVDRPTARSGQPLEGNPLMVGLGPSGQTYFEGRRVSLFSLRPLVQRRLRQRPDLSVILVADKAAPAQAIVGVVDELRLSGAGRIALATQREGG